MVLVLQRDTRPLVLAVVRSIFRLDLPLLLLFFLRRGLNQRRQSAARLLDGGAGPLLTSSPSGRQLSSRTLRTHGAPGDKRPTLKRPSSCARRASERESGLENNKRRKKSRLVDVKRRFFKSLARLCPGHLMRRSTRRLVDLLATAAQLVSLIRRSLQSCSRVNELLQGDSTPVRRRLR